MTYGQIPYPKAFAPREPSLGPVSSATATPQNSLMPNAYYGGDWGERYKVGNVIDQSELDRLLDMASWNDRATGEYYPSAMEMGEMGHGLRPENPGYLYVRDPANPSGRAAFGLSYRPEYADIEGLASTTTDGYDSQSQTAYTINGVPVRAIQGEGRDGISKFVEDTPVDEFGRRDSSIETSTGKYREPQQWQYTPTGKYEIVDGTDRYERDIYSQWAKDDSDDGLGGLGALLPAAMMFIPGFQTLAPALQGALMGGVGSGISGGDPLKGALLGGLGGWAGNAIGTSAFAGENPIFGKALASGTSGLIRSGGNLESALGSALTGGLSQYAGMPTSAGGLGLDRQLAALLGAGTSTLLRGNQLSPTQLLSTGLTSYAQDSTARPRQALIKGTK